MKEQEMTTKAQLRRYPLLVFVAMTSLFLTGMLSSANADLIEELETSLNDDVLSKFYPACKDEVYGGFFSNFGYDWSYGDLEARKMIVSQARHIYTASLAAQLYPNDPLYPEVALHGYQFIRDTMQDHLFGGYHFTVNRDGTMKHWHKCTYAHSFVLSAFAYYYELTGNPEIKSLAAELFQFLEDYAHDDVYLGYFPWLNINGDVLDITPYKKDMDTSLHIMEGFTALYRVMPEIPNLRTRLEEMVTIFTENIMTDVGFQQQCFTTEWTTHPGYPEEATGDDYRYNRFNYGLDIETGYVLWEAINALGWGDDPYLLGKIKKTVDYSLDNYGFNVGGGVPFVGYYQEDETVIVQNSDELFWAQAEGLNTLLLMSRLYPGDPRDYYGKFLTQWTYIKDHILDPVYGGWYEYVDSPSKPKGHEYFVAFHTGRAYTNCIKWLRDDQIPPTAPGNVLIASTAEFSVGLEWDVSVDNVVVSGYQVYLQDEDNLVGYSNTPSYTVHGLAPGATYTFFIKARDFAGNLSDASSGVSATTLQTVDPAWGVAAAAASSIHGAGTIEKSKMANSAGCLCAPIFIALCLMLRRKWDS